ncbi:MAG: hypothetical protein HQL74_04170 [Magnetococcales bacterium]|nr:hypothetical protein [Magnetococcales bacterium]
MLKDDLIFHLELQSSSDGMDWRMLIYYSLICQRYPGKVLIQKVLYVGLKEWHPGSAIAEPNLSFRYEVIDIRSIDCRELLDKPVLGRKYPGYPLSDRQPERGDPGKLVSNQ